MFHSILILILIPEICIVYVHVSTAVSLEFMVQMWFRKLSLHHHHYLFLAIVLCGFVGMLWDVWDEDFFIVGSIF